MAGLDSLDNPEVELDVLYDINGLADRMPGWAESAVTFLGEHGILFALVLLIVGAWFLVRRRADAVTAVAGTAWAGLAAGVAYLVNAPIRDFVARPRPFVDHPEVNVLVEGKDGYSFVSDHASVAMAVAVGLFLVHRTLGVVAFALALFQGFARVFLGVHYPSDVIGGFALGMAVALLLAPLAMASLTPPVRFAARTRALGWLARPRAPQPGERRTNAVNDAELEHPGPTAARGLAA
ncbi:phosphatase PAP2 family protein [Streptomyces litchfieldiae]|uniref:Phosphatase PAP2 family protein n=1 Tax=Streptomyces litchfieldiae TaxID=3075543 RepID=A0ABU2MP69_9ACTN|nr:phosphatase PAP2 family protein [Streptomyces sp. DSM 44938]MDT0343406.1 phosphatase PAP2 family protein [Streptomyces sp. DSM 44938]